MLLQAVHFTGNRLIRGTLQPLVSYLRFIITLPNNKISDTTKKVYIYSQEYRWGHAGFDRLRALGSLQSIFS